MNGKTLLTFFLGALIFLYPFIVYVGLQVFDLRIVSALLIFLIIARLYFSRSLLKKMPWLKPATFIGTVFLLYSLILGNVTGVLLYPVAVNAAMLFIFAYSLYQKPCIVEALARITEPNLDEKGVAYTENVTKVWCVFFVLNSMVSLYTTYCLDIQAWMLYNGFISYCLMGLLASVEFIVRHIMKKRNRFV